MRLTRRTVLVIALIVLVAAVHPWTWPARGARDAFVPAIVYAIVAATLIVAAIRLGDLPRPKIGARRRRPRSASARDATRAAEEILRRSRRR